MRTSVRLALAFLLATIPAASRGAAAPRPARTAAVGTVRAGGVITLQRTRNAFRSSGLWSAAYRFPGPVHLRAVRLLGPKVPPGKCDLVTQIRWAGNAGQWSAWTPANLLVSGDGTIEVAAPKPAEPVVLWRAVAPVGSDVTFRSSVSADTAAQRIAVGLRARDAGRRPVVRVLLVSRGGRKAGSWRPMAVGLSVPPEARFLDVLGMLVRPAAKPGGVHLRARRAMLGFGAAGDGGAFFQADFDRSAAWKVGPGSRVRWTGGKIPSVMLAVGPESPTAVLRHGGATAARGRFIEVRATVSVEAAAAAVSVIFLDGRGRPNGDFLSLRCRGRKGTYRVWGAARPAAGTAAFRVVLQAARTGAKPGTAAFHRVEVRAGGSPPAFVRRPPVARVAFEKPVQARQLEVRSFLLSADPNRAPSFRGYELEWE